MYQALPFLGGISSPVKGKTIWMVTEGSSYCQKTSIVILIASLRAYLGAAGKEMLEVEIEAGNSK